MLQLRPSASKLWMHCSGYAAMIQDMPNVSGQAAQEGTAAHNMAEIVLSGAVTTCHELIDRQCSSTGLMFTEEMADSAQVYVDYMQQSFSANVSEMKVVVNDFVKGTADGANYSYASDSTTLDIVDFKHGWGIVEAQQNWQLLCYALGTIRTLNRRCSRINMTIVQPRPWHPSGRIRTWSLSIEEAQQYFNMIDQKSLEAQMQGAPLTAGDHCKYCPAINSCPAVRNAALNIVEMSTAQYRIDIPNDELMPELDMLKIAEKVIKERVKSVENLAVEKAGKGEIPGYTVQPSNGRTVWQNNKAALGVGRSMGVDLVKDLVTPLQAVKAGIPKNIVDQLSVTQSGSMKLVKSNAVEKAAQLFGDKTNATN